MRLIPKWKVFKCKVEEYIKQADNLMDSEYSIIEDYGYSRFFYKYHSWIFFCHCYLKYSFDDLKNEFARSFYSSNSYKGFLVVMNEETPKQIEEALIELKVKSGKLRNILQLLSVCDTITQNQFVDTSVRSKYSSQDIEDLILDKLYFLSDFCYYPLQTILKGNGINLCKADEIQMVEDLQKRNLIHVIYSDLITVKISPDGQKLIENKRNFNLEETKLNTNTHVEGESEILEVNDNDNHQFIVYV
jgi:hypothetical protein